MSIMNIGERLEGGQTTPRVGKKIMSGGGAGGGLNSARVTRAKGRDTLIDEEVQSMKTALAGRGGENFVHAGLKTSDAKFLGAKGRVEDRKQSTNIFNGPVPDVIPVQRIRPDYDEGSLRQIHPGDHNIKKSEVAANMAQADDMLDKMNTYNYPINRKEEPIRVKRAVNQPQRVGSPVDPKTRVDGFSGMGTMSKPSPPKGIGMAANNLPAAKQIPVAGARNKEHNYNAVTGVAPGDRVTANYSTSMSASFKPHA